MSAPTLSHPGIVPTAEIATVMQAIAAAAMGIALLWAVGFSTISVLHNAAHDTRHSNAFPCH
jgi:cobalt transporter subunit CbtB